MLSDAVIMIFFYINDIKGFSPWKGTATFAITFEVRPLMSCNDHSLRVLEVCCASERYGVTWVYHVTRLPSVHEDSCLSDSST